MTPEQINQWRHRIRAHTLANYHYEMARALLSRQEPETAHAQLRDALRVMPDHALSSLLLMDALRGEGREAEASAVRRDALAAAPAFDAVERLRAGGHALSLEEWDKVPAIPPDAAAGAAASLQVMQEVACLLRGGEPSFRPGAGDVAADLFVDVALWGGLFAKALPAYLGTGRWADAVRLGNIGAAVAPGTARLEHSLGLACLAAGDVPQALQVFKDADRSSPHVSYLSAGLALANGHQGDAEVALAAARTAVRTGAGKPIAYSMLAWNGLLFEDRAAQEEALPVLALLESGFSPWSVFPLAIAALAKGNGDEAARLLEALFARADRQPAARLCFATLPGRALRERLLPLMLAAGYEPDFPPLTPA